MAHSKSDGLETAQSRASNDILVFRAEWPAAWPAEVLRRFTESEMECQVVIGLWGDNGEREQAFATRMLNEFGLRNSSYVKWAFDPKTSLLDDEIPPIFRRMAYLSWKTAALQRVLEVEDGWSRTSAERSAANHRLLAASVAAYLAEPDADIGWAGRALATVAPKSWDNGSVLATLLINQHEVFAEFGAFDEDTALGLRPTRRIVGRQRSELFEEQLHQIDGQSIVLVDDQHAVTPALDFDSISILDAALSAAKTGAERVAILAMATGGRKWTDAVAAAGDPTLNTEALQKRLARRLAAFRPAAPDSGK